MDQITLDMLLGVLQGLIANALTTIASQIGRTTANQSAPEATVRGLAARDTALSTILQKALAAYVRGANLEASEKGDKLRLFLVSPEAEGIVRQIYASRLTPSEAGNHLEQIRAEFVAAMSLHMGGPQRSQWNQDMDLFNGLIEGCDRALILSIEKGILSAHEAKSAARHRVILDTLQGIQKNLALLSKSPSADVETIVRFEEQYRIQVADRHRTITPPHFDAARKLPIDEIYVPSNISRIPKKKGGEVSTWRIPAFLSVIHRTVLLGNPGGGKSTLTVKICHDLATRYQDRLCDNRLLTPVLVLLRDYGAEKKKSGCSILQFIHAKANSTYQVPPPEGSFEYLFSNGRLLVIFDGLDELLDTSYRQEVSGDVESFCSLYPTVPVLVTSREVGYSEAPLDPKRFEIFGLAPFDDDQVMEYAKKWFSVDEELTKDQREQMAAAFFEESQIVPDLRSNPLMLGLMCNIYRGENYIPRNRPDIYEKCAVMLFERWDKRRGILVPLPFEEHIRPAMDFLAHWIYSNDKLQGGVTENLLVAKATEYLSNWLFDDHAKAEKAAREFIEFCRGRAWVFTDTGTTKVGDRLYQFTHRTFLEYFTAAYLVRTNPTPTQLLGILLRKIVKREWDVVSQLAFQIQHRNVEGAGDELLLGLLSETTRSDQREVWNLVSFVVRCLEFVVPRPRVTRKITAECIERCLRWVLIPINKRREEFHGEVYHFGYGEVVLGNLLQASNENRDTIASELERSVVERISGEDEGVAVAGLELAFNLPWFLNVHSNRTLVHVDQEFWQRVSQRILHASRTRISSFLPKYFGICLESFWRGDLTIPNLVELHGVEAIFRAKVDVMFESMWKPSIAEGLVLNLISHPFAMANLSVPNVPEALKEAGRILLCTSTPWVNRGESRISLPRIEFEREGGERAPLPAEFSTADVLFGGFLLIATLLELEVRRRNQQKEIIAWLKESNLHPLDLIRSAFLARFEPAHVPEVESELQKYEFTANQRSLARQWIQNEINFATPPRRSEVNSK